ncbi:MAG: hypothetical protein HW421_22 [Ignavibacteria bacterium]|nr:hypothetical protein [Ignavibacteria bacterium]
MKQKTRILRIGIFLAFLFAFFAVQNASATTYTFDGSTDNDWNTAANWTPAVVPTAADDAIIPAGFLVTIANAASGLCNTLTLNANSRVQAVAAGTATLAVGNGATGAAITCVGAGFYKIDGVAVATVRGTLNVNIVAASTVTITTTRDRELRINNLTLLAAGVVNMKGNYKTLIAGDLIFTTTASIQSSVGTTHTLEIGDDITGSAAASALNGDAVSGTRGALNIIMTAIDGTGAITVTNAANIFRFNDFIVANAAVITSAGAIANTFNFYGNLSVLGNGSMIFLATTALHREQFSGSTAQTIYKAPLGVLRFNQLYIGATANVTTASDFLITALGTAAADKFDIAAGGKFTATAGTIGFSTSTNANATIVNAGSAQDLKFYNLHIGILDIATATNSDVVTAASFFVQGDFKVAQTASFIPTAGTVSFANTGNAAHPKTIFNNAANATTDLTFANLTINSGSYVTCATNFSLSDDANYAITCNGWFKATAGTMTILSGGAITSTIVVASAGYLEFYNLTITDAANSDVTSASAFTIKGNLTGGTVAGQGTLTSTGTVTFNGTTTISSAAITTVAVGIINFTNVVIADGAVVTTAHTLKVMGNFTVQGNGSFIQTADNTVFDKNGTITITKSDAGTLTFFNLVLSTANSTVVNTSSNFTIDGIIQTCALATIGTFSAASTCEFDAAITGSTSEITLSSPGTAIDIDFDAGNAKLRFYSVRVTGNLGALDNAAGGGHTGVEASFMVYGNFTIGPTGDFSPLATATAQLVTFAGGTTKWITVESGGTLSFINLTIASTSGNVVRTKASFTILQDVAGSGIMTVGTTESLGAFIAEGSSVVTFSAPTAALVSPAGGGVTYATSGACQFQNLTIAGSGFALTPAISFRVKGNFTATTTGSTYMPSAGTVYFTGQAPQTIDCDYFAATDNEFRAIIVINPAGVKLAGILGFAVAAGTVLTLTSGDLDLNGNYTILLTHDDQVISEGVGSTIKNSVPTGTGYIMTNSSITDEQLNASGLGLNVGSLVATTLQVRRYPRSVNINDTCVSINRVYYVLASDADIDAVTITYDNSEIIGNSDYFAVHNVDAAAVAAAPTAAEWGTEAGSLSTTDTTNTPGTGTGTVYKNYTAGNLITSGGSGWFTVASRWMKRFTGASPGYWDVATNWYPESVPSATSHVYIPDNKIVELRSGATRYANSITIGTPAPYPGGTAGSAVTLIRPKSTDTIALTISGDLRLSEGSTASGFKSLNVVGNINTTINAGGYLVPVIDATNSDPASPTCVGINFNNLTISNDASMIFVGDYIIDVRGNLTLSGTAALAPDNAAYGTIKMKGGIAQTLSVASTASCQFTNLYFESNNTAVTTSSNFTVRENLTADVGASFIASAGAVTLDPTSAVNGVVNNGECKFYNLTINNSFELTPTTGFYVKNDLTKTGSADFAPTSGVVSFENTSTLGTSITESGSGNLEFYGIKIIDGSEVTTSSNFSVSTSGIEMDGVSTFRATGGYITLIGTQSISNTDGTLKFYHLYVGDAVTSTAVTTGDDFTIVGDIYVKPNATFIASAGKVTFDNTAVRKIRNFGTNSAALTFSRVTVAASSDVQVDSLTNNNFTIDGSGSGSSNAAGIEVLTGGTFIAWGGTINFAGANEKIIINSGDSLQIYNMTLAGTASNDLTTEDDFAVIGNVFTIAANASFIASSPSTVMFSGYNYPVIASPTADKCKFYNLLIQEFANATLDPADYIYIRGDFTVNDEANFTSGAAGVVTFNGAAGQGIRGTSTYATNPPVDFAILVLNKNDAAMGTTKADSTITLYRDIRISPTASAALTLTKGYLNLGSATMQVAGTVTVGASPSGFIDGATGTYEMIGNSVYYHTTALLKDLLFTGSSTEPGTLYNLKASFKDALDGNLTVNGTLTLGDYFDYSTYELRLVGGLTQLSTNYKLLYSNVAACILMLDSTGSVTNLTKNYFAGDQVYNLTLKRAETLKGDLFVRGTLTMNSGNQSLNLDKYSLMFEDLTSGTSLVTMSSGHIYAPTLSHVIFSPGMTTMPLNIFKNNECDALTTVAALTLPSNLKVNGAFTQLGGPFTVTTGDFIFTLGPNSTITRAFTSTYYVYGNLRRTVTKTSTPFNIGGGTTIALYRPVTLAFKNTGSSQDVLISSTALEPTVGRNGDATKSVNVTWNITAEGTAPTDSLNATFGWNTTYELDEGSANNTVFTAKWRGTSWKSYRTSQTLAADYDATATPSITQSFDASSYPIKKDSLSGYWAIFVGDNSADSSKDHAIGIDFGDTKVVVKNINPNPVRTDEVFDVTIELQDQDGQPVLATGSSAFKVKLNTKYGTATLTQATGSIPVGSSEVTLTGLTLTNLSGEANHQFIADTNGTASDGFTDERIQATISDPFSIIGSDPGAQASGIIFSSVDYTTLTVAWTNPATSALVVVRADAAISDTPVDGETYIANSHLGLGSSLGDGVVVYNGTGTSVNLTGLTPGRTYYFKVFSYEGSTGYENYLLTGFGTGNPKSQATTSSDDDDVVYGDNDNFVKSKPIGTNTPLAGTIKSATDEDWFNFRVVKTSPNIRVKLYGLPANYNVELYNSDNVIVRRAMLTGSQNDGFGINSLEAGTYTMRIYGVSGAFSAASTYTVKVTSKGAEIFSVTR